jgi:anti-sigma-K factor RskA
MIDERHEELASLYAFDLLEGAERMQFEAALARDPALQQRVRELREASTALARNAAVAPPSTLKQRVLASVGGAASLRAEEKIVRPPPGIWGLLPWAAAACFAITAAWMYQRYVTAQSEAALLRDQNALVEIAAESAQQQLEAQQIITRRQVETVQQQLSDATRQVGDSRTQLAERDRLLAEARTQLQDRDRLLGERDRELAQARTQLTNREQQIASLTQRIDALSGSSAEINRQLADARQHVARLTDELKSQGDLANLKITALASMLKNSPKALAVAVWDPKKQEGVLSVENLPALAANEDYQLWVVDPQYPNPVDGGVFTVEPTAGQRRLTFKTRQPVTAVNAFAVTRERKGGVPKAEGPFVLFGK